jgi:16S rRNA (guanine966-N2)-methyltransferase
MRITGGTHRSRILKTLSGRLVRPTSDRVRQALFNIVGARLEGARVLDLFAGTGSLGFEALSRGAAEAVFVDKDRRAVELVRENVVALGLADRTRVLCFDLLTSPKRLLSLERPFDVVFLDPPYVLTESVGVDSKLHVLLELLWTEGIIEAKTGLAVLEHDRRSVVAEQARSFRVSDRRTYGDTSVTFFVAKD